MPQGIGSRMQEACLIADRSRTDACVTQPHARRKRQRGTSPTPPWHGRASARLRRHATAQYRSGGAPEIHWCARLVAAV